jgi:predicted transcriptional regulator
MECSRQTIVRILEDYIHVRQDREVMKIYLTDYPGSLERLAEECDLSISTVKRIINRNAFIYKYLPGDELKTD